MTLRGEGPVIRCRFRAGSVTLYDWHCGGHGTSRPAEEWATAHEVVMPRRGVFQWEIGGSRALASPGTATFLHPAEAYRVRHPLAGGDAGAVFRLAPAGVAALLEAQGTPADRDRPRFPLTHLPLDGRAYLLHRLTVRAMSDSRATPLEVEERAVEFLHEAVAQACRRSGGHRPAGASGGRRLAAEYALRVGEVVAARYREPLTLAEVARAVGVSAFHLSRLVSAATGVPIYRMILRRRLREALERVLDTGDSITQIALAVGFSTHAHLTDAFRREYGVPPATLRARSPRRGCRRPRP